MFFISQRHQIASLLQQKAFFVRKEIFLVAKSRTLFITAKVKVLKIFLNESRTT